MKRVVVLGGGESGVGAALLAKAKGFETFLSDSGMLKENNISDLRNAMIDFEQGGHTEEKIVDADLVVKSPGIPDKAPIIKRLHELNKKIISEIEFAYPYSKAKHICITGSNGKTTTTLLTHHLLMSAGKSASLAGNVGFSLARQVISDDQPDYFVIELSSFQLDGMYDFKADIAILNNITPDHLDRYEYKFENYIRSKFRILQNQTKSDLFIANADDPVTKEWLPCMSVTGSMAKVSMNGADGAVTKIDELGHVFVTVPGLPELKIDPEKMTIHGRHNIYNAMQACVAALKVGLSAEDITKGLATFKNASHRLELVATINDVEWVDDSKATNIDSAWYALDAQKRPIVWIAGGTDKGNDYNTLMSLVESKVKALVCLGVDNHKLLETYTGHIETIVETRSMADCVRECNRLAKSGDVVLLSPCCASFDLFTSYVNRGNLFKEEVLKLNK
ncbi:MAG: UDP-N-acetylmuramoyl-L-alanine--D-glutamate ligase [Marinilabiliaceae bacterium]|nr:UDP-N-acetylmuramoyl-L-alanine--D-glutamate ligase [Marinilabiliaceae bacterium]